MIMTKLNEKMNKVKIQCLGMEYKDDSKQVSFRTSLAWLLPEVVRKVYFLGSVLIKIYEASPVAGLNNLIVEFYCNTKTANSVSERELKSM